MSWEWFLERQSLSHVPCPGSICKIQGFEFIVDQQNKRYDVIIIGGGPAGATLGCYLSMMGIHNLIIEKAIHPRSHVGESMVTATTRVFQEIGVLESMEAEGFVRKYGASWHAPANRSVFSIEFGEYPQEGIEQDYTYHVDRSKFDLMLLKRAEALGSQIIQGVGVKKVLFDEEERATGVQIAIGNRLVTLSAKLIVDASGRNTLLGRQLKFKEPDPNFNQFAIHAWFKGLNKPEDRTRDHIHIYFLEVERGWVWQIPITDKITSIGVVVDQKVFKDHANDLGAFFHAQIQKNENLARAMAGAERVNEFKRDGEYSYRMRQIVGNGWLMLGDAARFVDPIFSSGVSIAMYSAKFASEVIQKAFEMDDFSANVFAPYQERLMNGAKIWYEFISLYYQLLNVFTIFIVNRKYRLQVLQLLQGEVFDRKDAPVLDAMREYIETVQKAGEHYLKDKLAKIPVNIEV